MSELQRSESTWPDEFLASVATSTCLPAFLPTGVDDVQLILDLNALAARSGVTLSNFNIQDKDDGSNDSGSDQLALAGGSPVESIDISMSALGSYDSFRTFLSGIEQSLRPLDVVKLDVKDS